MSHRYIVAEMRHNKNKAIQRLQLALYGKTLSKVWITPDEDIVYVTMKNVCKANHWLSNLEKKGIEDINEYVKFTFVTKKPAFDKERHS